MVQVKAVRKVDAREALERWARWRIGGARFYGGSLHSLTGKLLNGLRWVACPSCEGKGKVPEFDPCPRCGGECIVKAAGLEADRGVSNTPCTGCLAPDPHTGELKPTGEANGNTCNQCRGSKIRTRTTLRVNPAGINGTRYYGANEDADPVSLLIDRTVSGWALLPLTYWLHRVVIAEYCLSGTQEMKAAKLGHNQPYFSKKLVDAHQRIESLLKTGV